MNEFINECHPICKFIYLSSAYCAVHFTSPPGTLINVVLYTYVVFYRAFYTLRLSPSLHGRIFLSLSLPLLFFAIISYTAFRHRGKSRLYFVFHQARIHSGAKQWEVSAHPPRALRDVLLFWALLHPDASSQTCCATSFCADHRGAHSRKPHHYLVPAFLPLSFTYNLHSVAFSYGVMQENGCFVLLVPKRGDLLCFDSSRFQMQMHIATKDTTKGLEGTYSAMCRLCRTTFHYFASNLPFGLFEARGIFCVIAKFDSLFETHRVCICHEAR